MATKKVIGYYLEETDIKVLEKFVDKSMIYKSVPHLTESIMMGVANKIKKKKIKIEEVVSI